MSNNNQPNPSNPPIFPPPFTSVPPPSSPAAAAAAFQQSYFQATLYALCQQQQQQQQQFFQHMFSVPPPPLPITNVPNRPAIGVRPPVSLENGQKKITSKLDFILDSFMRVFCYRWKTIINDAKRFSRSKAQLFPFVFISRK